MQLHYHPVSPYSQKTLLAFHEKGVSFTPRLVDVTSPEAKAAYQREVYGLGKIPLLVVPEESLRLPESSLIAEWLDERFPERGPRLIPADRTKSREVRMLDRLADGCLSEPMAKVVFDGMRAPEDRDPRGTRVARSLLDRAYGVLEERLAEQGSTWLAGADYSLADCAATPPLFFLQRIHPYTDHRHLTAYAARLSERPSWQKVLAEAAPWLEAFSKS
ncbi:glutathione S-transferase family protein [Vulgatibacter sp.]|uniref:glutathione S-transferase family protein n=1 Tax=Vulgatibacter sp. TaxID=1971226 RepID=UPI003565BAFD